MGFIVGLIVALVVWFTLKVLWMAVLGFFVGILVVWLINGIYPTRRL